MKINTDRLKTGQNLFEAIDRICGFAALEDDMEEILQAVAKDNKPVNVDLADVSKCDHQWIDINGGFKKLCIKCEKKEYQ